MQAVFALWTTSCALASTTGGATVSPWHDIPLKADGNMFHFVCEIPKETSAKMEVATVWKARTFHLFQEVPYAFQCTG